jgi:hypothetical protein
VTASLPNFYFKREQDHLRVEQIYEISNQTDPPRTVTGAGIPIFIPEDHTDINSAFTMEHNIPIKLHPHPTDESGVYHLHYPLKPGVTRLALSYSLPYEGGKYAYKQTALVPLQLVRFLTDDPQMNISSQSHVLEKEEQAHGFVSYRVKDLDRSEVLTVDVSGGAAPSGEDERSGGNQVVVRSVALDSGTIPIIVVLVTVLIALSMFGVIRPGRPEAGKVSAREALLDKIARLDDLRAADAVAEGPYQARRAELKNELTALYGSLQQDSKGK